MFPLKTIKEFFMNIFRVTALISCFCVCSLTATISHLSTHKNSVDSLETSSFKLPDYLTEKDKSTESLSKSSVDKNTIKNCFAESEETFGPNSMFYDENSVISPETSRLNLRQDLGTKQDNSKLTLPQDLGTMQDNQALISDQWFWDGEF